MLYSDHAHPVILLWDVKADDLKLLFNFMYEGQVNVAQERLSTFLTLAERLQVRGLTSTTGDGVLNRTAAVAAVKSIVPLVTPTGMENHHQPIKHYLYKEYICDSTLKVLPLFQFRYPSLPGQFQSLILKLLLEDKWGDGLSVSEYPA